MNLKSFTVLVSKKAASRAVFVQFRRQRLSPPQVLSRIIYMKTIIFLILTWGALAAQAGGDVTFNAVCDNRNSLATFSFVGDVLIHKALYQRVAAETKHFSQIWRKTDVLINKADFSVANLEGPAALGIDSQGRDRGDVGFIYDGKVYSGTNFLFNYHPRILSDLKASGYDLLTMANNHALDRQSIGIDKTLWAARQVGILTVGTRMSQERNAGFHQIVSVRGIRVAFLGCTEMTNGKNDSKDQVLFCYKNPERILGTIKELSQRPDVDAVVVLPHWGVEYQHVPEAQQRNFAQKYLEAGAIAVVGSHPHVLQPWQKYVTRDGRETLVIYSLGNFVAGQGGLARKTGTVAYIGFSKEGSQKAKIFGAAYTPTYRRDAELFPIGLGDAKDVIQHTAALYGAQGRLEPSAPLLPFLCGSQRLTENQ